MNKECQICQKSFKRRGKAAEKARYCSRECQGKAYRGKPLSEERRAKLRGIRLAEKSWNWKGDRVKKVALHQWVRSRMSKPECCALCKSKPPIDLASIGHVYSRELSTWKWLCRSCHAKLDGRVWKKEISKMGRDARWKKWRNRTQKEKQAAYEKKKKYKREWAYKKAHSVR